jgi:hypothetical protein
MMATVPLRYLSSMDNPDPRLLEVLEQFIRERHTGLAEVKSKYRQCTDRLEGARAAESQAQKALESARAELAAAQADMTQVWEEFERVSQSVDAGMRERFAAAIRAVSSRSK